MPERAEYKKLPESRNIKKIEFPEFMTRELVDLWADGIPLYDKTDPTNPEWRETPVIEIPMEQYNFQGKLFVKDESDLLSNPTGTFKDRAAWEIACLYRDFARGIREDLKSGELREDEIGKIKIPKFSLMSAGNEAIAVSRVFEKFRLPPPKVLIGKDISGDIKDNLQSLYCDLYETELGDIAFEGEDILALTENSLGEDITSSKRFRPNAVLYDWLSNELFNKVSEHSPARSHPRIYLPYGSGRLMENVLYWQGMTKENLVRHTNDPRFHGNASLIAGADVIAAKPVTPNVADKVYAQFRPFIFMDQHDIDTKKRARDTGSGSGIETVEDDYIVDAHQILKDTGVRAEPSAAIGLALALQHNEQGLIQPGQPIFTVNTGQGIVNKPLAEQNETRKKIRKASGM